MQTNTLITSPYAGNDAFSVLFNKLANGESVEINGSIIDAEQAIVTLVQKWADRYEVQYMSEEE